MNSLEKQILNSLIELKENYAVCGVKAEFEAEGARIEEVIRLKELTTAAGLDLTIKIGGCEAITDMHEAKKIGVNNLVAPMIESSYALKKYINATKKVFSTDELENISFFINIETITGYNNIDAILEIPEAQDLSGIVLGRSDMTESMGYGKEMCDSETLLNIAKVLSLKSKQYNKKFVIGGGISPQTLQFFAKLSPISFSNFETRKVIFDSKILTDSTKSERGIIKALEFELMWLKNKQNTYTNASSEDEKRISLLENFCKQTNLCK